MKKILIIFLFIFICSLSGFAGPYYLSGNISNVTSTKSGFMIMLDTGVPDNCIGTPYGWLLIKQEDKTIIAVAMLAWLQNLRVTVYCDDRGSSGFGIINQIDPAG